MILNLVKLVLFKYIKYDKFKYNIKVFKIIFEIFINKFNIIIESYDFDFIIELIFYFSLSITKQLINLIFTLIYKISYSKDRLIRKKHIKFDFINKRYAERFF